MTPRQLIDQLLAAHGGSVYALGHSAYRDKADVSRCKNRWYRWRLNHEGATLGNLEKDLTSLGLRLDVDVQPLKSTHTEK